MEEITDFDKRVYNMYLVCTRNVVGEKFRLRKNFDKFEEHKDYPHLKALSSRFTAKPHLMCKDFFEAPFKVDGGKFYPLKYYASMQAIGAYSRYKKQLETRPPDEQLDYIKNSFAFIYKFCLEKKLRLNDYAYFKSFAMEDFLKHIKDHNVSIYVAFSIPSMYTVLVNLEPDVFNLYFGEIDLQNLQLQYQRSRLTKGFCQRFVENISKRLDEFLAKAEVNG